MKCRRVEKLIPLYVEGDLASGISDRISSHLEWCGRCNWLADEYKESQSWLRSSASPEFDDAALNTLKTGILNRIAETSAKPSLLANLMQHWTRRQVFALAAAMLIIGVLLLYIDQVRRGGKSRVIETASVPSTDRPASNEDKPTADRKSATTTTGLSKQHRAIVKPRVNPQAGTRVILKQKFEPLVSQTNPPGRSETGSAKPIDAFPGSRDDLPEMLRIEIQTSDPTIRIIWFAPKEAESPNTNQ